MTVGYIGLTVATKTIIANATAKGISVVLFDRDTRSVNELSASVSGGNAPGSGLCIPAGNLIDFMGQLPPPRTVMFRVPDPKSVDPLLDELLAKGIAQGDIFVDIGMTPAEECHRHYNEMRAIGCGYIDAGIMYKPAGGAIRLTVGGDESGVQQLSWLWNGICGLGTWKYTGPPGTGHASVLVQV